MYDTYVTIVGNVLAEPEWRRTANTKAKVTTFKIASTARRYDRTAGQWIDGNSLRVRVSCWRSLADNVFDSVTVGDPLIVTGRLYTRDWVEEATGAKRLGYELEAIAVGHNLVRGKTTFRKVKVENIATSATEEPAAAVRAGGEETEPMPPAGDPDEDTDAPPPDDAGPVPVPVAGAVGPVRPVSPAGAAVPDPSPDLVEVRAGVPAGLPG